MATFDVTSLAVAEASLAATSLTPAITVETRDNTVFVAYQRFDAGSANHLDALRRGFTEPVLELRAHVARLSPGGNVHFTFKDEGSGGEGGVADRALQGALVALRNSLAVELPKKGIRVTGEVPQTSGLSAAHADDRSGTKWEGRHVMVIGASSGLGEATAMLLASKGAHVLAVARRNKELEVMAEHVRSKGYPGDITPAVADVTLPESLAAAITAWTASHDGERFAAVFHCAGSACMGLFDRLDDEKVGRAVDINIAGTLNVFAHLDCLEEGGNLAVVASAGAHFPWAGASVYAAVKRAQHEATEAVREELAARNIHVTSVLAGAFNSPIWSSVGVRRGFDFISRAVRRVLFASSRSTAKKMLADVAAGKAYSYPGTGALTAYRSRANGWLSRLTSIIYPFIFGHGD